MHAWVNPPPLPKLTGNDQEFAFSVQNETIVETEIDNTKIRLINCPVGEHDQDSISYQQHVYFTLNFEETCGKEVLGRWIRPLQDLLIFAIGRSVRLTSLLLRPADADPFQELAEAYFAAIQPASAQPPTWASLEANTSSALFTLTDCPLSFNVLMANWLRTRAELAEVFTLLHGPSYVDFMFSEHRFASLFQSAEALAYAVGLSGREKSRSEHRERVSAIMLAAQAAGVDSDVIGWATRILQSRNDKPMWKQIYDLVQSTGRVGQRVLAASPEFSDIVASARHGVSHGGASRALDPVGRHWYGEVLRWVVRARVMVELGVSLEEVEQRMDRRSSFQFALDHMSDTATDEDCSSP